MLETYKAEISRALPRHVSPDRMLRMVMTSCRKNPEILNCTPESVLGAAIQSAQLGLEPDTPMGHAYLIPFFNKATGKLECSLMPGYRGYMDLIYRVKEHPILNPVAVFQGDIFEYQRGTDPFIKHSPQPHGREAKLIFAYVTASFADGRKEFDVMTRDEIEAVRARSKATGFSPWKSDYAAMACKSVIRRFAKYLPMSAELQTAIGLDDLAEVGEPQHNESLLKTSIPIETKGERVESKMSGDPGDFNHFK